MLRKIILLFVLTGIFISVSAQEIRNDIIQINYEKKSVSKAMILSSLFPGAGQFYANRRSITTYIFPIIEIGLWVGYFHYYNQGLDKEDEYEKWANQEVIGEYTGEDCPYINPETNQPYYMDGDPIYRYGRERHDFAVDDFLIENNNPSYDNHFRLDDTNTQHFYEDIGKYNKHIFGWFDWFNIYATDENGNWTNDIDWNFDYDANGLVEKWVGMGDPADSTNILYIENELLYEEANGLYSGMRTEYIEMRKEARDFYKSAEIISFGLVFNHILSAFDAARITRRYNLGYITNTSKLQIHLAPVIVSNELSPALFLTKRF
jgi:hypothetical protein